MNFRFDAQATKPQPSPLKVSGVDVLVRALSAPYNNFTSKALLLKADLGDQGGRLVATGFDILQVIHTPSGAANLSTLNPQKAWLLQRILQYAGRLPTSRRFVTPGFRVPQSV